MKARRSTFLDHFIPLAFLSLLIIAAVWPQSQELRRGNAHVGGTLEANIHRATSEIQGPTFTVWIGGTAGSAVVSINIPTATSNEDDYVLKYDDTIGDIGLRPGSDTIQGAADANIALVSGNRVVVDATGTGFVGVPSNPHIGVQDGTAAVGSYNALNFAEGFEVADHDSDGIPYIKVSSGVSGTIDLQEEGGAVSTSGTLNVVGDFATATDVGGVGTVTIQNPTFENLGNVNIIAGASDDVLMIGADNTTVVNLPKRAVQRLEYNIAGTIIGVPNQGEILAIIPFSDSVLFDTNLPNSRVYAATAPVAAASVFFHFNDKVNDIWAVAAWAAGATEAIITATETTFTSVNTLMIKAPNPADADLNTIGFNIKGVKQ